MIKKEIVGISSKDHKYASLFFDYIIPTFDATDVPQNVIYPRWEKMTNDNIMTFGDLIEIANTKPFIEENFNKWLKNNYYVSERQIINQNDSQPFGDKSFTKDLLNQIRDYAAFTISEYLKKNNVLSEPIFFNESFNMGNFSKYNYNTISLILTNIPIIDTNILDWKQIINIRKDKESLNKLRNLKLFFFENYVGKDLNYIEDSLCKGLDEYYSVCKKYEIDIKLGSMMNFFDSKLLVKFISLATLGIIFGEKNITEIALISGASVELGKVGLQLIKRRIEHKLFKRNFDLAYLVKIQESVN
jgi:hypothetical protein